MELALNCPMPAKPVRSRSKTATRPQLLTWSQLDGRTNAAKMFDQLAADIETDLGGRDQLFTIERALIEVFCGATVTIHALNTKLALGEQERLDLSEDAAAVSAMG